MQLKLTFASACRPNRTTLEAWLSCPYTCKRIRPVKTCPMPGPSRAPRTRWPCNWRRRSRFLRACSLSSAQLGLHRCWFWHEDGSSHRERAHFQIWNPQSLGYGSSWNSVCLCDHTRCLELPQTCSLRTPPCRLRYAAPPPASPSLRPAEAVLCSVELIISKFHACHGVSFFIQEKLH